MLSAERSLRLFRSTLGGARDTQFGGGVRGERVGLAVGGERPGAHVVGVARDGVRDGRAEVCVLADEARTRAAEGEAEEVVRDENLRVAVRARADAYGRHVQSLRHHARYLARHDFEDDREDSGLL